MTHSVVLPDGRALDLDYFVAWRPYLWRKPVADALAYMGDLRGKRVLEIGGGPGRMASLFAMLGADVTMLDRGDVLPAEREAEAWGVSDRVRACHTEGGFDAVAGQRFDVVFTKSVLWCIEALGDFLNQINEHLEDHGKVAFTENYRGGRALFWIRKNLIHRGRFNYAPQYHGIRPDQIPLFRRRFSNVRVSRHRWLVYMICGEKG